MLLLANPDHAGRRCRQTLRDNKLHVDNDVKLVKVTVLLNRINVGGTFRPY